MTAPQSPAPVVFADAEEAEFWSSAVIIFARTVLDAEPEDENDTWQAVASRHADALLAERRKRMGAGGVAGWAVQYRAGDFGTMVYPSLGAARAQQAACPGSVVVALVPVTPEADR